MFLNYIQTHYIYLLDVSDGVPLWEGVRVSLPEDMPHTRTRNDLH